VRTGRGGFTLQAVAAVGVRARQRGHVHAEECVEAGGAGSGFLHRFYVEELRPCTFVRSRWSRSRWQGGRLVSVGYLPS
jgi:hypothetical protein